MKKILALFVLMLFVTSAQAEDSFLDKTSIGIGLGIPYGILGVNVSYKVSNTFDLTAGAGVGVVAGIRYRPLVKYSDFRLTALYGINSSLTDTVTNEDTYFSGLTIGFGQGNIGGFDFDVLYVIAPNSFKDRVAEIKANGLTYSGDTGNVVAFSLGYHW